MSKYLSTITNFRCHHRYPYYIVKNNNQQPANITIKRVNKLKSASESNDCNIISAKRDGYHSIINKYSCDGGEDENNRDICHGNRKRGNKREREEKYLNRLKRLDRTSKSPISLIDEKFINGQGWITIVKPYYKRLHRRSSSKYYKKYSNHVVRRYKGYIQNGNNYRKLFDYWWEIN